MTDIEKFDRSGELPKRDENGSISILLLSGFPREIPTLRDLTPFIPHVVPFFL
jgi:hypothetical protein